MKHLKRKVDTAAFTIVLMAAGASVLIRASAWPHARSKAASPPSSWTEPFWAVDTENLTGCASNDNTCTSATCAPGGVGPCADLGQIVQRWGTTRPELAQATVIDWISDAAVEPVFFSPQLVGSGSITLMGSATQVAAVTLGTVVLKNRSAPQLLTADLGQAAAPFVGDFAINLTHPSVATIDAATGTVATFTQPTTSVFPPTVDYPPEVDTWAENDAITLSTLTKVNLVNFSPMVDHQINSNYMPAYVYRLRGVGPPAPNAGIATISVSVTIRESRFDRRVIYSCEGRAIAHGCVINTWLPQSTSNAYCAPGPCIYAGAVDTLAALDLDGPAVIFDGDVILHFQVSAGIPISNMCAAYIDGSYIVEGTVYATPSAVAGSPVLWGPGQLLLEPSSQVIDYADTAASSLLMKGGISFNGAATASAYDASSDPAAWHGGRSLTAAKIDAPIASGGFGGKAIDPASMISIITGH